MPSSGVASSIIGGGGYSYIRVHRSEKQSISKEINNAEHEYMNMPLPQLSRVVIDPTLETKGMPPMTSRCSESN